MSSSIGGFFVDLGLHTDKDSFDKGFKAVDNMTNSINRLVGTIRNAAPVIMAGIAGSFETAELKTAKAIGISTRALDSWKTAASMAGTNANGLAQSMANLEQIMQRRKLGYTDTNLASSLSVLGLNYQNFAEMNAEDRMSAVIKNAQAMADQGEAALLVGNILGDAGKDYYYYLQLSGRTLEDQLAIGKSLVFTSDKSKQDAMIFNSELQGVISAGKSMSMLFGSEVGKQLTPIVRGVREWIGANNGLIQQDIVGFVDDIGTVFNKVVGAAVKVAPLVKDMIDGFGGLDQLIIKIGIGIAALQVGKLAMNLMSIFGSVSMVKLALMGLGAGVLAGGIFDLLKDPAQMEKVTKAMSNLSDAAKKIAGALKPLAEKTFETVINLLNDFSEIIGKLIDRDWTGLGEKIKQFFTDFKDGMLNIVVGNPEELPEKVKSKMNTYGETITNPNASTNDKVNAAIDAVAATTQTIIAAATGKLPKSELEQKITDQLPPGFLGYGKGKVKLADLPKDIQEQLIGGFNAPWDSADYLDPVYYGKYVSDIKKYYDKKTNTYSLHDGIISPNGTVTQVDPNDWVFAAKDLGKLASAFIPQAYSSNSSSSYIINQTFNVSGSHDIPSTIKQQAYAGTQAALLQNVNNSATRLQLMSNTY